MVCRQARLRLGHCNLRRLGLGDQLHATTVLSLTAPDGRALANLGAPRLAIVPNVNPSRELTDILLFPLLSLG